MASGRAKKTFRQMTGKDSDFSLCEVGEPRKKYEEYPNESLLIIPKESLRICLQPEHLTSFTNS